MRGRRVLSVIVRLLTDHLRTDLLRSARNHFRSEATPNPGGAGWIRTRSSTLTAYCVLGLLYGLGCASTLTNSAWESRVWKPSYYEERVTIRTEPSGARIYVQDEYAGISPVDITLVTDAFAIEQSGYYTQEYTYDGFSGTSYGHHRASATTWADNLSADFKGASWQIKAHLDGFEASTHTHRVGPDDMHFKRALSQAKPDAEGRLASRLTGTRSILIALRETPGARTDNRQGQQQQQQQQTVIVPGQNSNVDAHGKVNIMCNQDDADVYIDGIFVGNAPASIPLASGLHIIEVKKAGFPAFRREIRVIAGSEVTVRADLRQQE